MVNTEHKRGEKIESVRNSARQVILENDPIPSSVRIEQTRSPTSEDTLAYQKETGAELNNPIDDDPNLQTETLQKTIPNSGDLIPVREKPKNKGFLSGLLRRERKENEDGRSAVDQGNQEQKDRPKKKERAVRKDEVVYLNDEDIDDLIE